MELGILMVRSLEMLQNTKVKLKNIFGTCCSEVNHFISEYLLKNSNSKKCSIINPVRSVIKDLSQSEISLLLRKKIYDEQQEIYVSQCAWINFKSMNNFSNINC